MAIVHDILPTDRADDTSAVHDAAALAAVLSVLADPTRLAILSHLRGAGLISTHTHGRASVSALEHPDELTAVLVAARTLASAAVAPDAAAGERA